MAKKNEEETKGAIFSTGFFAHDWEPPEKDDEDQPIHLRTFRELDWIWEEVLPRGGTSVVSAGPKVGKTFFVTNLAVAHARGDKEFLGRKLGQGIVTMLILEGSPDQVMKHAKILSEGEVIPLYIRTFFSTSFQNSKAYLRELIQRDLPSLLIIDTLWKLVRSTDVADYAIMAQGLELIDHLARDYGTHIMVTHHDKKKTSGDITDVLGSTSIVGGVDTAIQISRHGNNRRMWSTQRHGTDLDPFAVGLVGKRLVRKELYQLECEKILILLGATKNLSREKIRENIKGRREDVYNALDKLCEEGKVVKSGLGLKRNPYVYNLGK